MNEEIGLGTFKYFLECYFNVSTNYDELERLINDFISFENYDYHKKLREELNIVLQQGQWEVVQEYVKKFGMRNMNVDKIKWLVHSILENL
jgi:hypothetical protein